MTKISIIIPAYNEEKRIEKTLERCLTYIKSKKNKFEIIVVNDGSKDDTAKIVKKIKGIKIINYSPNHGKGYAVRKGILSAKGDYILFSDADLSAPIEELDKLMQYVTNYDVVIASRAVKYSDVKTVQYRRLLGRIFAFIVNILAVKGIHDTQCGFKLFRKNAAKKIFRKQLINGWAFDVEVLYLARKLKYKIKEVGIKWEHVEHENVAPTGQSFKMLKEILKIRLNNIKGKYN